MQIEKFLPQIPLFSVLNQEELKEIANLAVEKYYPQDSIIFFEGEEGTAFYFLKSGRIKISKFTLEGGEQILKLVDPGSIFAEVILFSDEPYPATARVLEDAQIVMIRKNDFEKYVMERPRLAIRLLKLLNSRLREAQVKVKEMGLLDTHSRTASLLLRLAQEYGEQNGDTVHFVLKLNRQDLANMIGTTRETVSRVLSKFKKAGLIEMKGDLVKILAPEELMEWIEQN